MQLHHGGNLTKLDINDGFDIVAPSADAQSGARALTRQEITDLVAAFGHATRLAIQAGFDGVEIHGANNYLIQQFWSAQTNRRDDEWGGSAAKRMAFPLAIVDAVNQAKEQAGRSDFIVGYRFSPEEPGERGLTMADTFALIDALVEKPLQYLHVSLWDFYKKARRGADTHLTRMQLIHERINGRLPLIGVGNLITAEHILAAWRTGWADLIAVGKTIMMNPNLIELIKTGREAEIATTLDPERADRYHFPDELWRQNMEHLSYLPPVKGHEEWVAVDI